MKAMKTEIFDLPQTNAQAAMSEVADTTTVFDSMGAGRIQTRKVPGMNREYVPFGMDDQLPYELMRLVDGDEVTAQNKFFNVITCYGMGPELQDTATGAATTNADAQTWARRNLLPSYFLNQCTDMKYFFFSVAVIILSRDGSHINRLVHKESCYCRLEAADGRGRIRNVFYADWRDGLPAPGAVERIPLLDMSDPWGDLCRRMGRDAITLQPMSDMPPSRDRKFAILLRYPTAGCQYYPVPYYSAMFRGGSYDEKRLISAGKRAKLRNHVSVKYQIEIVRGYFDRLCDDEGITDPVEQVERVRREKENIRDFVAGVENSGKAFITQYYVDPDGHEVRDIRITNLEGTKEGGDWGDDINVAANTLCYADNVHPNLVGAVPGKSQSNNSGSDKRELFTMKQACEKSFHDLLLIPLQMVCWYNQWKGVQPVVPMIMLTTLDEHQDAKQVTLSNTVKE